MSVAIRNAGTGDEAAWRVLWGDYLRFYAQDLSPDVTAATWARIMDAGHPMALRLAFDGPDLLGFALHLHHASSWVPGDDVYLEDLFVAETARGMGVGRALIDDLIAIARARGWHRVYWHTDRGNLRAQALYDSIVPSDGHIRYRLRVQ